MQNADRPIRHVGWWSYVIGRYLHLCTPTEASFPIWAFGERAVAALSPIDNAEEKWLGSKKVQTPSATVVRSLGSNSKLS